MSLLRHLQRSVQRTVYVWSRVYSTATTGDGLKRTALYDYHQARGGRMVEFAGWSMPVQYSDLSISQSTLHTRQHASLFDVSHMLQLEVCGSDAESYLESVIVADLEQLNVNTGTLSLLTTERGGIIDDVIVTRTGHQSFYIVANAACADKDLAHLRTTLENSQRDRGSVSLTVMEDRSLIAFQGPKIAEFLDGLGLGRLKFMSSVETDVCGVAECQVTRCGYTGEDGVEISVATDRAVELAERLTGECSVKWAGLGARDILRLEAGLCLYGNDISENTTPVEAGLAWCISRRRRKEGGFMGSEKILSQLKSKPDCRRVGLCSQLGPPARSGAVILTNDGEVVGHITSGCPSPTLKTNIAMGYVPRHLSATGQSLQLKVRTKVIGTEIVKMPFLPHKYYIK